MDGTERDGSIRVADVVETSTELLGIGVAEGFEVVEGADGILRGGTVDDGGGGVVFFLAGVGAGIDGGLVYILEVFKFIGF